VLVAANFLRERRLRVVNDELRVLHADAVLRGVLAVEAVPQIYHE
jgi:hypothetical protein